MSHFATLVREELDKANALHAPYHSAHEGYGVLLEEVAEFFDEVRKKRADRNRVNMVKELVQIGAVVQRIAESLGLIEKESPA